MPLDDKEQEILAQIERQFYEENPELAHAVRRVERPTKIGARLALLGVVVGLAIVIAYVSNTLVAVFGFALLVASATALVNAVRARGWRSDASEEEDEEVE